MLLERPLSLQLIFHYYTQINQQRDRIIRMQQSTYEFFSLFFFFLSSSTLPSSFLFFLFFLSFLVSLFICLLLVCSCFFSVFLLLSIPAFFPVLLVDVMLWCSKTVVYGNQVRSESLQDSAGTSTNSELCYIVTYVDSHLHTCTYICKIIHNDTTTKTDAWRTTHEGRRMKKGQEDFFRKIFTSLYL